MSAFRRWYRGRSRVWRLGYWVVLIVLLYAGAGAWLLPAVARSQLEKRLAAQLHRPVRVGAVAFNPFTLRLEIRNLSILDADGRTPFVSFERFSVNLQASSALRLAPVLKSVELDYPRVFIVRRADGTFNFSDLLQPGPAPAKPQPSKKPGEFHYRIANIRLTDGQVVFVDRVTGTRHRLDRIFFSVPLVTNFKSANVPPMLPEFSARLNGSPIGTGGETTPFAETRPGHMALRISRLDLARLFAYAPGRPNFTLSSAKFEAALDLHFDFPPGRPPNLLVSGMYRLSDVEVLDDRDETFLRIPELTVEVADSQPLAGRIHVTHVTIREPYLATRRDAGGAFYVPGLSMPAAPAPAPTSAKPAVDLRVDRLELLDGTVVFADASVAGGFDTRLDGLCADVRQFSLGAEPGEFAAGMVTESGEALALAGTFSVAPLRVNGAVDLARLNLVKYRPYYDALTAADLRSGVLSLETCFAAAIDNGKPRVSLSGASIDLEGLAVGLKGGGDPLVSIPSFRVADTALDLTATTLSVGSVKSTGGRIGVVREAGGAIDLLSLAAPPSGSTPKPAPGAPPAGAPAAADKPSWAVSLGKAEFADYGVTFRDEAVAPPVTVTAAPLGFSVEHFSLAPGAQTAFAVDVTLADGGRLKLDGNVGLKPLAAQVEVSLADLNLVPFQPYWLPSVNLLVTEARLGVTGRGSYAVGEGGKPSLGFAGDVSVAPFVSVDPAYREPFLKWRSLDVRGIDAALAQGIAVGIREISLTEPAFGLTIQEDKSNNLAAVLRTPQKTDEAAPAAPAPVPAKAAGPAPTVTIESIRVDGGRIGFLDRTVKPNYAVTLSDLKTQVTGLTAGAGRTAELSLQGLIDGQAKVDVKGKLNPDRANLYVDVAIDCHDIELPPFTPYSGRFVGYEIQKGKLNLDLKYLIDHTKLKAENRVFLDQFTLGGKTHSPDAPSLPIPLALALLKNRAGEIKLDVPVQGDLSDPKFRVWPVVVQVLTNIVVKAATSPFALLGSLVGTDEKLDVVLFEPGRPDVSEAETKKLGLLAKALYDRPALRLEIAGGVDPATDRPALQAARLERELRAAYVRDTARGKGAPADAQEIQLTPAERDRELQRLYEAAVKADPALRSPQKQPAAEEMQTVVRGTLAVSDEELQLLAGERARKVMDYLAGPGAVEAQRMFLIERGKTPAADAKPASSVTLSIK